MTHDQAFFDELERQVLALNNSGNPQDDLESIATLIQNTGPENQAVLRAAIDHKQDMLSFVMGTGEADNLGSTKLGPGTGVLLGGARGEILGALDANRSNEIKDDLEDLSKLNEDHVNVFMSNLEHILPTPPRPGQSITSLKPPGAI